MLWKRIYIQPLALDDIRLFRAIVSNIESSFNVPVRMLPQMQLPSLAYDPNRNQYCSSYVLKNLSMRVPADGLRLLAVTGMDIYAPQFNYVFGQAAVDGSVSVISVHRLNPEFYGDPPNRQLLEERTVKEAIHELGHTFGLRHCSNSGCVMQFSNCIEDTDRKSAVFLDTCADQLHGKLGMLKAA